MAITLTGNGSLFGTLGVIFAAQRSANGFRGTTAPNPANATWGSGGMTIKCLETIQQNIFDQLKANTTLQSLSQTLFPSVVSARNSMAGLFTNLQTLAQQTVVSLATNDQTLPDSSLGACLAEVIRQMVASGDTVDASTASVSASAASGNTGDAVIVVSAKGQDGTTRQNVFPETIMAKVKTDSQQGGGGTAGREQVQVSGDIKLAAFDPLYPANSGSGASISFQLTDPSEDAGQNVLNNSDSFFSGNNTLSKWTAAVGTAGTDILSVTAANETVRGSYGLKFYGANSTLSEIRQTFGDSSNGTSKVLAPNTLYAYNVWLKKDTGAVNGNLTMSLMDGSNSTISDDAGTANTVTQDVASLSNSSFTSLAGVFITPKVMPSTVRFSIRLTTALTTNKSLFIDELAFAPMMEIYKEGPSIMGFQGKTNVIRGDYWTVTVSNDLAGQFQTDFDRNFDMRAKRLQLPSNAAGNETISDGLIA